MPSLSGNNSGEPFGWNRGSVRALALLALLAALITIAFMVTWAVLTRASAQFVEQFAILVIGALIGAVNLAVGWYYANRSSSGAGGNGT